MKKTAITTMLVALSAMLFAQPWMQNISEEKRENNSYNFYDIQEAFNSYWEGKTPGKGSGWKQFKRQEWFLEQRVYPSGEFNSKQFWKEIKNVNAEKNERSSADWVYIGAQETPLNINSGQRRGSGRINCVAFHPSNSNILFAGAPAGGFWKSSDAGQTWQTTTDNLASLGVSSIAVHPNNPNIIYIATGDRDGGDTYSAGVLKSTDGGLTWGATGVTDLLSNALKGSKILLNPNNPSIGYYASSDGLYKTTDDFASVTQILSGSIKDIELHPTNSAVIYAAQSGQVHISENSGSSFSLISSDFSDASRIELAVTASAPDALVALCGASDNGLYGVFKSSNRGNSWTELAGSYPNMLDWSTNGSGSGGQAWYDLALAVSPTDEDIIFIGGVNIWNTTDGGNSWEQKGHWTGSETAQYVHADQHIFAYSPSGEMFAGNDGGLYKTANSGDSWSDISDGLQILQPYKLSTSPTDPDRILIGNQDNGTFLKNNGVWNAVMGGDGMECIIDYENENILYGSVYYGSISKSIDGGRSFSNINVPGNGAWVTPYIMHPTDHNTLYVAKNEIYKTTDGGDTWSDISNGISQGSKYRAISISPVNPDYIYATDGYTMWSTTDGGQNWTTITPSVSSTITYIACSDTDAKELWISLSGFNGSEKALKSTNTGANWINISTGLPNIPINCIVHQKESNGLLYAGTDVGVYVKNDGMANWQLYSSGLPNVIVSELEINYTSRKLVAATYGRGVWESSLYVDETSPAIADFLPNTRQACTDGTPVIFTDNSYGVISNYSWNFGAGANPATATGVGPHSVSYSSTGIKMVELTVTASAGTDIVSMEISATAELVPEVSPASAEMCVSNSVELVATGGDTYTWSPANSLDVSTGNAVVATPNSTETYTITAQTGSCTGTAEVVVQVNSKENDDVENAILLVQGDNGYFSNECATIEPNEPTPPLTDCNSQNAWCGEGGVQGSVWFKIRAPQSGNMSVESHGFDNQLALYDADSFADLLSGNYTLLAANDDYFNEDYAAAIENISGLTPDKFYWLQMDGSAGGAVGEAQIIVHGGVVSVGNLQESTSFEISPNPTVDRFSIDWGTQSKIHTVQIYNINGEIIFAQKVTNQLKLEMDFSEIPSGVYFVKGIGETKNFSKKLVIKK